MNANRTSLGSNEVFQRLKETAKTEHANLWDYRHARLNEQIGAHLPDDRKDSRYLKNNQEFFATLALCVKRAALNGINQRPQLRIEPLVSVAYSDGQEMITITAIVLAVDENDRFQACPQWEAWQHKPGPGWSDFVEINVPHVSQRERHAIHAVMSHDELPGPEQVGFSLHGSASRNAEMLEQYCSHYLRYPTFAPLDTV